METSEIGTIAGIIWVLVDKTGNLHFADIKEKTKLDTESLYLALGWLARENKIVFDKLDRDLNVTIIY